MAKTMLGVDIGHDQLKLVQVSGTHVKKTAIAQMPESLLRNGRIVSVEAMGELIRTTMQKAHIYCRSAAVLLSGDNVFVRNVTMPLMTAKQLEYNLPFEFHDYISGEIKSYLFDYAMITTPDELRRSKKQQTENEPGAMGPEDEEQGKSMQLMAVAVLGELMDEVRQSLRKAGLKMVKAAPDICSYSALLTKKKNAPEHEVCILDLGYSAVRMYVFRDGIHMTTRVLDQQISGLDRAIADEFNIDIHLAHTYLLTNHENCQSGEVCMGIFNAIAVELMRALNFYRFSNPNSELSGVWLVGGGANIKPLQTVIENTLDVPVNPADTLLLDGVSIEDCATLLQAVGITQA